MRFFAFVIVAAATAFHAPQPRLVPHEPAATPACASLDRMPIVRPDTTRGDHMPVVRVDLRRLEPMPTMNPCDSLHREAR
ncbi:MAG TPA: hypothetical protein VN706_11280 [Gemmatimonadaceae bacterium]|nr:hypothetical protein [Gemmatimonadaceae bacterium]